MQLTKKVAKRVLEVVDVGLCSGIGIPEPGKMCVEAAVCFAMGQEHGDQPECVSPAIRALKIELNDKSWSSNTARAKGLRRLAIAQLGSKDVIDDVEFAKRVSELAVRKNVPIALRAVASIHPEEKHKLALEAAALACEKEGTQSAAESAESAAWSAAESAAESAESAAWSAAESAAESAESAAESAESAAKSAAWSAAWSAAKSAESAAKSAAWSAAESAAYDNTLATFAEGVVQILIAMDAPGCKYLGLTEEG